MDTAMHNFLEAAPDAMLLVNVRGEIAHVNTQALNLFGYTAAEPIGQKIEVLVPESVRGRHVAHRDAYLLEPKTRPMAAGIELVGRRKDGSEFPVEISLSPMPLAGEQFVAAAVRDTTAQRGLEQELREQQSYSRGLVEASVDALMTVNPAGVNTDVNEQAVKPTGCALRRAERAHEYRHTTFLEVIPEAMSLINTRGQIVRANDLALTLFSHATDLTHSVEALVPEALHRRALLKMNIGAATTDQWHWQ